MHAKNKIEWCLKKAQKEGKDHRGLKKINLDLNNANKYVNKAIHNLNAMQYFIKGGYVDWAVSAGFYTMYHCLLAVLAKYGYESRNQECTFAVIENLINENKTGITIEQLRKIVSFDENSKTEEIIKLREKFQYGTETSLSNEIIMNIVGEAKELIETVKLDLKK